MFFSYICIIPASCYPYHGGHGWIFQSAPLRGTSFFLTSKAAMMGGLADGAGGWGFYLSKQWRILDRIHVIVYSLSSTSYNICYNILYYSNKPSRFWENTCFAVELGLYNFKAINITMVITNHHKFDHNPCKILQLWSYIHSWLELHPRASK